MKRLIIFLLLTLSILEVSEGIFCKKKSSNDVLPPAQNDKHKGSKCKWKKKKKHTTTESPMNNLIPSLPKPGDSVLPGPYDPSSISKQIDEYFGPIWKCEEPDPKPNCGLPYFPTSEECTCPSPHGNTKKPKSRRRRFFGCFGGGSSSEEGGERYCLKHKTKPKPKGSKHKKGKGKKGKRGEGSSSYENQNEVYYF